MKVSFGMNSKHHFLIAGLIAIFPLLFLTWEFTSIVVTPQNNSSIYKKPVEKVATLTQTTLKTSSLNSAPTPQPQPATDTTTSPAVAPPTSTHVSTKPTPTPSKIAETAILPMPPLTALELYQSTPQSADYYWVKPVGSMPLGSEYKFFWANACDYPVPGSCINNNLGELEEYGNTYVSGSGSFEIPPSSYNPNYPLAVVVCEYMNGQCNVTSNLIFIPATPGGCEGICI